MAAKRTTNNAAKKAKKPTKEAEVIELSSDSEPEVPPGEEKAPESIKKEPSSSRIYTQEDYDEMPLLKVEGIKYDVQPTTEEGEEATSGSRPAKLPVRVKDTGSARHRHVSIEIPLMSSSLLAKNAKSQEAPGTEDAQDEDVFKTPMERRHITFSDSDNEEFVTPLEAPLRNPLEAGQATKDVEVEEEQEEDEDSGDEAPEAISSHAAGAHLAKVSQAATKAAQKQAAAQKQRRQERDAFLKQQAEKRKSTQVPEDKVEEPRTRSPRPLFPEKRKREVPKLLPLELLESDDEDEANHSDSSASKGAPKRKKLVTGWVPEAKGTRDQKVGSTVFRVVDNPGDKKLAPKAKKAAVHMREVLLKRAKAPHAKKGFFVKSH
ncbi:hypothetical protein QBC34DRAFT_388130 [Podospora aff. communis PSN243]|uniref:Uncharacterized protein n=1 Tax=Podospora aff. communis PSN243 TaxID=3040156 RepID=A0AAV9H5Z0_9PEZI|nr:hypothetical protein QBC34DRAFT_388130 [Podospora aff. communis PSN243]